MHRHFLDFDAFLAELVLDRVAKLKGPLEAFGDAAGTGTVVDNVVKALTIVFDPLAVAVPALVITRRGLRARLREAGAARFPLIAEASVAISAYLAAEQVLGRLSGTADVPTLSHTVVGGAHLLFSDRESGPPGVEALHRLVASVLPGADQRPGMARSYAVGHGPATGEDSTG